MTPAELAKITKSLRDIGFSKSEIDACGGAQASILAMIAAQCSEVLRSGNSAAYGARRSNGKTLKHVDDDVAKRAANAPGLIKKQVP